MAGSNATGRGFASRVRLPDGSLRASAIPLLRELLLEDRVLMEGSDCWFWTGLHRKGRPFTRLSGKTEIVSRLAYQLWHGPIPAKRFVCHRCDVPGCWNPAHLFVGTPQQNMDDMWAKGRGRGGAHQKIKTHCPQGHEYTEATTYLYEGRRYCRLCHTVYSRAYMRKKRSALIAT